MSLKKAGIRIMIRSDRQDGGFESHFTSEKFYSNNPEYRKLFNSMAISRPKDGELAIRFENLIPGVSYQLDTYHFQAGVGPGVRQMYFEDPDVPSHPGPLFTYHNADEGPEGTARNAVRVRTVWVAESSEKTLYIKSGPGFNRAVLNSLVLSRK